MKIPFSERRSGDRRGGKIGQAILLRSLSLGFIVLSSAWGGYRLGLVQAEGDRQPAAIIGPPASTKAPLRRMPPEPSVTEQPDDILNPASEYFTMLEKNHLVLKGQRMAVIFARNPTGKALAQVLTLIELRNDSESPESKRINEQLTFLESQAGDTLEEIRNGLSNFEGEFNNERQFLIQYVGRLDLELGEKTDFLTKELVRNSDLSENRHSKINAIVALTTMMRLDVDQSTIEAALKQVLAKASYTSRVALLTIYESKYPDQIQKIESDLAL